MPGAYGSGTGNGGGTVGIWGTEGQDGVRDTRWNWGTWGHKVEQGQWGHGGWQKGHRENGLLPRVAEGLWTVVGCDRAVASPEGAGGVPSVPACPTAMWLCLLLALALLGTVSASHPAPRQPQGVPAGETTQLRYAVVKKLRTYSGAQSYCKDVYRGQLASVHSAARNQELQKLAGTYKIIISPWIGAVTSRRQAGQWESYWEDSSPWNYANWAPTHPFHIVTTCTTLSIRDGLWRSHFCFQLRPFICQY
ncbi:bone marrow proteoglycan-like isoform X3 [Motacilla alba alba]|uniref:bone marrow proteoglycan-like isoform X3 n=1 Tax=Motacilla alba alba TaxID=1094192 RepID=UPI0018D4FE60|nr:bone marrow proteoglycan-like isoform X3 [Motacilla alba alba]